MCLVYGLSSIPAPTLWPPAWKFLLCISADRVNVIPGWTTCWNDNPTSALLFTLPYKQAEKYYCNHFPSCTQRGDNQMENIMLGRLGNLSVVVLV